MIGGRPLVPKPLSGKVAIVTGGTSGIGAACAAALVEKGASVAIVSRGMNPSSVHLDALTRNPKVLLVTEDVSRRAGARRAVLAAVDRFGGVDVLMNMAGIIDFHGVADCPEVRWDAVIRTNLKSVYLMSHFSIPFIRRRGGGSIVNASSVHAYASLERVAAYAATKGAILALSRQMAIDYAPDGIRVNALVIGGVDTPQARAHIERLGDVAIPTDDRSIGRLAAPEEVASVAVFLVTPEGSFVNGAPVIVDGGLMARMR